MGDQVDLKDLGAEWNGFVAKITGGNDKQGFAMMQGVLTNTRVRLLLRKGAWGVLIVSMIVFPKLLC